MPHYTAKADGLQLVEPLFQPYVMIWEMCNTIPGAGFISFSFLRGHEFLQYFCSGFCMIPTILFLAADLIISWTLSMCLLSGFYLHVLCDFHEGIQILCNKPSQH